LPPEIKIHQGGVVHFMVSGFHQVVVYDPGTKPEDIVVPSSGTFINDLTNKEKAASLRPKPAPRPEPIYAIGSQEYAAQQERLRLQRLEQGEDEDEDA
jgi:hypothetical protein